ncbi:MAG: beta-lactamase [Gemmatimonadetes bacterium]|nr:beta-lactamase [Gemmatimonadota bacterium]
MTQQCRTACVWRAGAAAVALFVLPRGAAAQEPYPGLDAYVARALQTLKVPGAAVAIVRNDSVIYAKGFGVLAAGSTTPVTEQTLFEIGSSSKAFTATVVAMMVSDGKMRYDDLISKYLPDFKLYDPIASAQVTIRDGLAHRSGIGRGELVWIDAGTSRDDVLHRVRFLKPESPFRSRWSYQNILYLAVGEAAGRAGGSTWDDLIQHRIFTPLGMVSSSPTYRGVNTANIAIAHAMDHDTVERKGQFNAENIAPAGAILSNARDMAQWLRFQLNNGVVNGTRLVSVAALRETHTPQMLMGATGAGGSEQTLFNTYGMGWMVQDYRHELMWQHGGNTPGMTTAVGMLPEKKIGVVVLSSMDHTPLPDLLMRYIFDRHLGAPVKDYVAEASARALAQRRPADTTTHVAVAPPLPLSAYVGTYADSLYGEATVALQNGRLEFTRGLQHGPLEYWNASNFRWWSNASVPATTMYVKFEVAPDNTVTGVYFGLAPDVSLLARKAAAAGGRRGGG